MRKPPYPGDDEALCSRLLLRNGLAGRSRSNRRERLGARKPAVAVSRRLRLRKASVRELRVARLLFDAGPVAERDLVHGIRAPVAVRVNMLAPADRQDCAAAVFGSDDPDTVVTRLRTAAERA